MDFVGYNRKIVQEHEIRIDGIPGSGILCNPVEIESLADLTQLRDALRTGTCRFVPMSASDMIIFRQDLMKDVAEGRDPDLIWAPGQDRIGLSETKQQSQPQPRPQPPQSPPEVIDHSASYIRADEEYGSEMEDPVRRPAPVNRIDNSLLSLDTIDPALLPPGSYSPENQASTSTAFQ